MTERKKKLKIIQIFLMIFGLSIILITFLDSKRISKQKIFPTKTQNEIKKKLAETQADGDIFYNIEYSGLDLAGNRFILRSKEATNSKLNSNIINMKYVEANFYFKDNTTLKVKSNSGVYNNKTLDMSFYDNIKADYENSELTAEKAEYSNLKSFLIITNNVKIKDSRGSMIADKLLFDIKKQVLNISSINDKKVNANIDLKWKKVLEY